MKVISVYAVDDIGIDVMFKSIAVDARRPMSFRAVTPVKNRRTTR